MASVETELYMLGQRIKQECHEAFTAGWEQGTEYAEHVLVRMLAGDDLGHEAGDGVQAALDRIRSRPVI